MQRQTGTPPSAPTSCAERPFEGGRREGGRPGLVSVVADRLEVVVGHVADDGVAEGHRRGVCGTEVQARPDAGLDDLRERLREVVEGSRLAAEATARYAERDVVSVEHLEHAQVRSVETDVP